MQFGLPNIVAFARGASLALATAFMLAGCFRVPSKFSLTVSVTNSDGEFIQNAEVFLDDRIVGFTDENGQLQRAIKTFAPNPHQLRIKAHKNGAYVSKYEELLDLTKLQSPEVQINAKLYAVEKQSGSAVLFGAAPTTNSAEPAPESLVSDPTGSANETALASNAANNLSSDESMKIDDELEAPLMEDASTAKVTEENASQTEEQVPSSSEQETRSEDLAATQPETSSPQSESEIETIHVFHQGKPIEGACIDTQWDGTCSCTTAASGRCSVDVSNAHTSDGKSFAIIRKSGFKSQSLELQRSFHSGIPISKVEMEQGAGLEVVVFESEFFEKYAVAHARIIKDGTTIALTDQAGFAFIPNNAAAGEGKFSIHRGTDQSEQARFSIVPSVKMQHVALVSKRTTKTRIVIADVGYAGNFSGHDMLSSAGIGPRTIFNAVRKEVFSSQVSQQLPRTILDEIGRDVGRSVRDIVDWGWSGNQANHHADAVVVPTLVNGHNSGIVLSLRTQSGDIAWAKFVPISTPFSWDAVAAGVSRAAAEIVNHLPVSAYVESAEGNEIKIKATNGQFQKGETVTLVWQEGAKQYQRATAIIRSKEHGTEVLSAAEDMPRPMPGSALMVLRRGKDKREKMSRLFVKGALGSCPRVIYFSRNEFAGTNEVGCEVLMRSSNADGMLVAENHQPQSQRSDLGENIEVSLKPANPIVRIATVPASAVVRINGRNVGHSPVNASVKFGDFPAKIELSGVAGFREQEITMTKAETNLTGGLEVKLEARDVEINNSH